MPGRTLMIDADDTLWENSIYFEAVIEGVQAVLRERGADPDLFRSDLEALQQEHVLLHGYGTVRFTRTLIEAFRRHLPGPPDSRLLARVRSMSLEILAHPVELLHGVEATLDYLSRRHTLHLVTKGCEREQLQKIRRSGIGGFFASVEVVSEKDVRTYADLMTRRRWHPRSCWMVGNSPRSDINPALAAGLHAVYIPHDRTWKLEEEETSAHPRLLRLSAFPELQNHF